MYDLVFKKYSAIFKVFKMFVYSNRYLVFEKSLLYFKVFRSIDNLTGLVLKKYLFLLSINRLATYGRRFTVPLTVS